jgi:hypothetical protein
MYLGNEKNLEFFGNKFEFELNSEMCLKNSDGKIKFIFEERPFIAFFGIN